MPEILEMYLRNTLDLRIALMSYNVLYGQLSNLKERYTDIT